VDSKNLQRFFRFSRRNFGRRFNFGIKLWEVCILISGASSVFCGERPDPSDQSAGFIAPPSLWFPPPLLFSTWHPPFRLSSSHRHHDPIFIASIPKLHPQIALDLLYPATPLTASKALRTCRTSPGYVSISNSVRFNRPIAFSLLLYFLP
jgi:hypothetical protein